MKVNWEGVYPAVTTKFTTDDKLDLNMCAHNIHAQLAAGVDGIILGGTLGEASSLMDDEKDLLVKATVEMVEGRVPVVMNIAEQTTKGAIIAAEKARKWCFGPNDASSHAL